MLLSEQAYTKIDKELAKYPADQRSSAIMSSLRIAQEEHGWLSSDLVAEVARYIGVEPIAVQEVATFYNMFEMKPVGKFKVTVCTNLPCALRDGVKTAEYIKEKLGIGFNETTPDGAITLKEGECMGACGDSPVLLVNNHHMCVRMSQEKIDEMLADMLKEAQA